MARAASGTPCGASALSFCSAANAPAASPGLCLEGRQVEPAAGELGCFFSGFHQPLQGLLCLASALQLFGFFAQVVRQARGEAAGFGIVQLLRNALGLRPVARTFVDRQQGDQRFALKGRSFQLVQGGLGAVEQTGLQKVQRQCMLGAVAVFLADVGPREQVFVHAHGAVVVTPAAKQVAQREVQFGGVGVALHGFDEGVDGLVLLFVQQVVQAAEIGLGRLSALHAPLAQIQAGSAPAKRKGQGQAPEQPGQVKIHVGGRACRESGWSRRQTPNGPWPRPRAPGAGLSSHAATTAA